RGRGAVTAKQRGLLALPGGMDGGVAQALAAGKPDRAQQLAAQWAALFGDRYYLEVTRTGRNGEQAWLSATVALALEADIPLVATNDVRFLQADEFEAHEARVAIHEGYTLADPRRPKNYTKSQYFKSAADMAELFADLPEALANTVAIARRCNLQLTLGENVLPEFPVPEGYTTAGFLRAEANSGLEARLAERYPDAADRDAKRLQ